MSNEEEEEEEEEEEQEEQEEEDDNDQEEQPQIYRDPMSSRLTISNTWYPHDSIRKKHTLFHQVGWIVFFL